MKIKITLNNRENIFNIAGLLNLFAEDHRY
jgi:hypothetical protein